MVVFEIYIECVSEYFMPGVAKPEDVGVFRRLCRGGGKNDASDVNPPSPRRTKVRTAGREL